MCLRKSKIKLVLLILVGVTAFSQILAFTGVSQGLVELVSGLTLTPIFILIAMQVILLIMGMFIDAVAIMMITIPIYMPIH